MPTNLPAAHIVRPRCTLADQDRRAYARVSPSDGRRLGLPAGVTWWWCVLPPQSRNMVHRLGPPRVGNSVGRYMVYKVLTGFHRGRAVGIVGMR